VHPVSSQLVASAAVVVRKANPLVSLRLRSTLNPVSSAELSVQLTRMEVDDSAVALRPLGARIAFVVACATAVYAESPAAFVAHTR
jgi:hypothetical protein